MKILLLILSMGTAGTSCGGQQEPPYVIDKSGHEYIDDWQAGWLDIHQISTGRGNSTFMILPDGTTFMIDAGDLGDNSHITQEIMKPVPSAVYRPAEWIARYVKHFSKPLGNDGAIDYLLLTHFDSDHCGIVDDLAISAAGKDYKLTGVTHLAQLVDIRTLIDRGYPDYDYPTHDVLLANNSRTFPNYYKYVQERERLGKSCQMLDVGSNMQIKLLKSPSSYDFEVRNICVNGTAWSDTGNGTTRLIPDISTVAESNYPDENRCSAVIRMSYGKFDYFSGGDILGAASTPSWKDLETPIGKLVGPMDVVLCNHHAFLDAMNKSFIQSTMPRVFIIPVWDYYHPQTAPLDRMLDETLYEGKRDVFAAGMVPKNRLRLGENGQKIKPEGHIVVRVYEGGSEYQVFVLNQESRDYEIVYRTERISSK